jgi:hypothetical protein
MVFSGAASKTSVHNDDLSHTQILAECSSLGGALWEDRAFSAQGDRALYLPRGSTARYNGGQKIKWLRPNEMTGAGSSVDFIRDGAESGDVIQGELGDCYLLGAMSSIASAGLLKRLVRNDQEVAADLAKGFITFTLYTFGDWVEVSVDTLLPVGPVRIEPVAAPETTPHRLAARLVANPATHPSTA